MNREINIYKKLTENKETGVYLGSYKGEKAIIKIEAKNPPASDLINKREKEEKNIGEEELKGIFLESRFLKELEMERNSYFPRVLLKGEKTECRFLVLEYKNGKSLEELLRFYPEGLKDEDAYHIAEKILMELCILHQRNKPMVHRDLKPANIVVGEDGEVYIIDFGACIYNDTVVQCMAGTYGYSSPEQFWPQYKVNCSSDIYSFGKILYFILTGNNPGIPPYLEEGFIKKDGRVRTKYKDFLSKCLSFSPQDRFPNAMIALEAFHNLPKRRTKGVLDKVTYQKCVWVSNYKINE